MPLKRYAGIQVHLIMVKCVVTYCHGDYTALHDISSHIDEILSTHTVLFAMRSAKSEHAGYSPIQQDDSEKDEVSSNLISELDSAPSYLSPLVSRRWYRTIRLASVALLLFAVGFGACKFYWSKAIDSTFVMDTTSFDYSGFYGIPKDLPTVKSGDLFNQKELDLDTGFIVSSHPQTREFTFNVTQALASPDGFKKPMILINNQFPGLYCCPRDLIDTDLSVGPLIEANTGDTIVVQVNNQMSNWSTTIHWHGIDQKNSTWMVSNYTLDTAE